MLPGPSSSGSPQAPRRGTSVVYLTTVVAKPGRARSRTAGVSRSSVTRAGASAATRSARSRGGSPTVRTITSARAHASTAEPPRGGGEQGGDGALGVGGAAAVDVLGVVRRREARRHGVHVGRQHHHRLAPGGEEIAAPGASATFAVFPVLTVIAGCAELAT